MAEFRAPAGSGAVAIAICLPAFIDRAYSDGVRRTGPRIKEKGPQSSGLRAFRNLVAPQLKIECDLSVNPQSMLQRTTPAHATTHHQNAVNEMHSVNIS